jgi:hypothetical protein
LNLDKSCLDKTGQSSVGDPFPSGTNKGALIGINPKTLMPTKTGPLKQESLDFLKSSQKQFEPIDVDSKGNILNGHHRADIAIKEGRSVDVNIQQ